MKLNKTALLFLTIAIFTTPHLAAEESPVKGTIAIFSKRSNSIEMTAAASKTLHAVYNTINSLGRFIPIEHNRFNEAILKHSNIKEKFFKATAKYLNVDIYIIISIARRRNTIYGEMKIIPISQKFSHLAKIITVKSKIPINIPIKFSKEIVKLHKDLPLNIKVLNKKKDIYLINAGQWHGLKEKKYKIKNSSYIKVIKTLRYRSYIKSDSLESIPKNFIIEIYPEKNQLLKELNSQIENNTIFKYSLKNTLLKGANPEKKFTEACIIINPGANACLPGYGSYLATEYLGFKNPPLETTGTYISISMIFLQLNFTEFLTGYQTNFFPWIKDSDKNNNIHNLQIFLWSSMYFTATSSFLNQLAYNYEKTNKLPPFFDYKDQFAVALSLFSPGGGLFYKGYKSLGWGYYFTEMILLSFGVYNVELNSSYKYYFAAFGAVKIIELLNAYFIKTSFSFYKFETSKVEKNYNFYLGLRKVSETEAIYQASINFKF